MDEYRKKIRERMDKAIQDKIKERMDEIEEEITPEDILVEENVNTV